MTQTPPGWAEDADLEKVVAAARRGESDGILAAEALLASAQNDPRLQFLYGSLLAGQQRYDDARRAMSRAVEIAPDFAIARWQLGLLEFSSGRADDASAVWAAFDRLPETDCFRVLSQGLRTLARDEFVAARALLIRGMALNTEHPLVNGDMQLIIDEIDAKLNAGGDAAPPVEQPSAVDFLLQQHRLRGGGSYGSH